jgi:hypothetical protein
MDRDKREQILADSITPWLERGYLPRNVTDQSAYLVEQRTYSIWLMLLWCVIVPVLGMIFYVAYAAGRWCKTVTITVDGKGQVWVQEDRTPGLGKEPPPILKRTLRKRQRRLQSATDLGDD